jgi:mono/diheme cytochrome c family protein
MRTVGWLVFAAALFVAAGAAISRFRSTSGPAEPTRSRGPESRIASREEPGRAKEVPKVSPGSDEPKDAGWLQNEAVPDSSETEKQLRSGLVAVYRSLAPGAAEATLTRIDLKPAFTLGQSSPHPRIAPGPFKVVWTGALEQSTPDTLRFGARLGGTVTVTLDGVTVLTGSGSSESSWIESTEQRRWPNGVHTLRIVYRSFSEVPARLQLWWEGLTFSREPLPAWRLKHRSAELPVALEHDEIAARGRAAMGRLGCARCHSAALPAADDTPPGPSLAGVGRRVSRAWLLRWLEDPARVREAAHMPALFSPDRNGFVERFIVAESLLGARDPKETAADPHTGRDREGKKAFLGLGCIACHPVPGRDSGQRVDGGVVPLKGLTDRMTPNSLSAFLADPQTRYPDGRMPQLPLGLEMARDIAAYLLKSSAPATADADQAVAEPVTTSEINAVAARLGVSGLEAAGGALMREKRCQQCHTGLAGEAVSPAAIPIQPPQDLADHARGCLSGRTLPRFVLDAETRKALATYLAVAAWENHPSPFEARQRLLNRYGCAQCHRRDADLPAPLEAIASTIVEHNLRYLPSQRTPRLSYVLSKYRRSYVLAAIRDGVAGVRPPWYSYRMPAFGNGADRIVQALAEADGDVWGETDPPLVRAADPELSAAGPSLVGSTGYGCVACHVWNGQNLTEPEPGAAGPELLSMTGRIRRDFFDRWLEDPSRVHPRTPMPGIFRKGERAQIPTLFDGDAQKQKAALWAYFALGKAAPSPKSLPPTPVPSPPPDGPPLVAQIPIHLPDRSIVEGLCVLYSTHDLLLYDVGRLTLRDVYCGAQILRVPGGRRSFELVGTQVGTGFVAELALELVGPDSREAPKSARFLGYDRLADGVRIRSRLDFASGPVEVAETIRLAAGKSRSLLRDLRFTGIPASASVEMKTRLPEKSHRVELTASVGQVKGSQSGAIFAARFLPEAATRTACGTIRQDIPALMPPSRSDAAISNSTTSGSAPGLIDGPNQQPGYRAIAYPRPTTSQGEDLVMPGAIVANPRDGRVFIASMKMGELFVLHDPHDNGQDARFEPFGGGLFQDAYSMVHDGDSLYLLHRRNLTRIRDSDRDGRADTFDRVAALDHGVAENVDNAYGLVRDRTGAFVFTYAVNTPKRKPGWGSVLRLSPGEHPAREELAFGMRRAYGWSLGPEDEVFFTDNQGEWVATNKLCHVDRGVYYGHPNPGQEHHLAQPAGKTAVWIPYGWATSTNGLVYDVTGGRFGPFAGQFFLAGWTERGGIIRAQVEKVNGVYQGACFPFWDKGMLGPLVLAFDPKGRLYVGGITEATCGGHPDRGALFRIEFTGELPFEIQSIHVLPCGFRLVFTAPIDPRSARESTSYTIEHYRYEYSGDYGSPELDRTRLTVDRVELSSDGRSVDLTTSPLVEGRVYLINAGGVNSVKGETLVHAVGAYTLNEIPSHAPGNHPLAATGRP